MSQNAKTIPWWHLSRVETKLKQQNLVLHVGNRRFMIHVTVSLQILSFIGDWCVNSAITHFEFSREIAMVWGFHSRDVILHKGNCRFMIHVTELLRIFSLFSFPICRTSLVRTLVSRMTSLELKSNWTKIAFLYYMQEFADLCSMWPQEAHDVSLAKTKQNQRSLSFIGDRCVDSAIFHT